MGKPDGYDAMGDVVNPKVSRWFAESLPKYMNPASAPGQAAEDLGGLWTEHVADPAAAAIGAKLSPENELLMRRIATSGFGASKEGMANFQGSERGQQGMASLDKNLGAASPAVLTATDALPFFLQQALLAKGAGALGTAMEGAGAARVPVRPPPLPQENFVGPKAGLRDLMQVRSEAVGSHPSTVGAYEGPRPYALNGPAGYNIDNAGFRPEYAESVRPGPPSYPGEMMGDISAEKYIAENEGRATGKLDIPNWLVNEKGASPPRPYSAEAASAGNAPERPAPADRSPEGWDRFWRDQSSPSDSVTRTDLVNYLLQKSRSQPSGGGGL